MSSSDPPIPSINVTSSAPYKLPRASFQYVWFMCGLGPGMAQKLRRRESSPHSRTVISRARRHSHFVPEADICSAAKSVLFDHLVGGGEQLVRHGEAERLRRLEIYNEIEFDRLLYRNVRQFHSA